MMIFKQLLIFALNSKNSTLSLSLSLNNGQLSAQTLGALIVRRASDLRKQINLESGQCD